MVLWYLVLWYFLLFSKMQIEAIRFYIYYNIYKINNIYTYRIIYHLLPSPPFSLELKNRQKVPKYQSHKLNEKFGVCFKQVYLAGVLLCK